ncbi:hypothetical protein [Microbacterium gorillae]|uniref:hypothetical protein n=1 Tax=Microbacterium gorillae TaxID=1231063 RepID=UPI00058CB265|nr:hypothetical protein [Microbacterium gorillae]
MTPELFRPALDAYARSSQGARRAFADDAYFTGRFLHPGDDHARRYAVPSPAHVARYLLAPALFAAEETAPSAVAPVVRDTLASIPRRFDGGLAYRAPQSRREHLDTAPPTLRLTDYYRGLHAATTLDYDHAHPENAADFDQDAYGAAIVAATLAELDRLAAKGAKRTAPPGPRTPRTTAPPQTSAKRVATFRRALEDRKKDFVRHIIAALTLDLAPGEFLARDDVRDAIVNASREAREALDELHAENDSAATAHTATLAAYYIERAHWDDRKRMQPSLRTSTRPRRPSAPPRLRWADVAVDDYDLPPFTPPVIGPREASRLAVQMAPSLGLVERRSGNERRFYVAAERTATEPPATPKELPVTVEMIRAETEAYRELRDAIDETTAAEERRHARQRDRLANGDTVGALTTQRAHFRNSFPANVTPLRRTA